jgi:hypothetical protein
MNSPHSFDAARYAKFLDVLNVDAIARRTSRGGGRGGRCEIRTVLSFLIACCFSSM